MLDQKKTNELDDNIIVANISEKFRKKRGERSVLYLSVYRYSIPC